MTPIGARIKAWRLERDWTQAELAERAGVRRATVVDWERGHVTARFLDTVEKLAKALDRHPTELLGYAGSTSRRSRDRKS